MNSPGLPLLVIISRIITAYANGSAQLNLGRLVLPAALLERPLLAACKCISTTGEENRTIWYNNVAFSPLGLFARHLQYSITSRKSGNLNSSQSNDTRLKV